MSIRVQWKVVVGDNTVIHNGLLVQVLADGRHLPHAVILRDDTKTFELIDIKELKYVG